MKFEELLLAAIQRSEIPLRFEPGAEEAVARPVTEMLKMWIAAHVDDKPDSPFESGGNALAHQLLAELDGSANLPE